jgi:hypothetical protein
MKRLLVVTGLAVGGVATAGEPPVGVERTLLEQEFHLPERPRPTPGGVRVPPRMPAPADTRSVAGEVRSWLVRGVVGPLGVSPLVKADWW